MNRYVCIHGHFYQPPRENPWLESVEVEHSAYPYHDWNERITAECYWPNAASQILDKENRVIEISDNYARMSFDFGPTLLAWLEVNEPETYRAILAADKESQQNFSGHGSAIAQAYNHLILPLANRRDKYTQVLWGIRDFEHRFHRTPEGMWLPETAVDLESLDIMAELGIKFTILAPRQAFRVRKMGTGRWQDFRQALLNTTRIYEAHLPSGRKIAIFFYNGPVAHALAFQGLLKSGEELARRLTGTLSDRTAGPQLANVATDGESYGHHHRFGDMALAYALRYIESHQLARITNYAEFLEQHPPLYEVEIIENTSWSCAHGVERWRSNCGCNASRNPAWNQEWRGHLRHAFDWLRDGIGARYEQKAGIFFKDPWQARDDYINVVLDRSPESIQQFLKTHTTHDLDQPETVTALKLMELQRHAMLMYTSCGWFFDELSGFETLQVMQYAGRATQLAGEIFGDSTERKFLEQLALAKSNLVEYQDGRNLYEKFIKPEMVDARRIAANEVITSFHHQKPQLTNYCFRIETEDYQRYKCVGNGVAVGTLDITSLITMESQSINFLALSPGREDVTVGVKSLTSKAYQAILGTVRENCSSGDSASITQIIENNFGDSVYTFGTLFRDVQYQILGDMLSSSLTDVAPLYHQLHQSNYPLMRFVIDQGVPFPGALRAAFEFIINTSLRKTLAEPVPSIADVKHLLDDARIWNVSLDGEGLGYAFSKTLANRMAEFAQRSTDSALLDEMIALVGLAITLPFNVSLHRLQFLYYRLLKTMYPAYKDMANSGDSAAWDWLNKFTLLGERLSVRVV